MATKNSPDRTTFLQATVKRLSGFRNSDVSYDIRRYFGTPLFDAQASLRIDKLRQVLAIKADAAQPLAKDSWLEAEFLVAGLMYASRGRKTSGNVRFEEYLHRFYKRASASLKDDLIQVLDTSLELGDFQPRFADICTHMMSEFSLADLNYAALLDDLASWDNRWGTHSVQRRWADCMICGVAETKEEAVQKNTGEADKENPAEDEETARQKAARNLAMANSAINHIKESAGTDAAYRLGGLTGLPLDDITCMSDYARFLECTQCAGAPKTYQRALFLVTCTIYSLCTSRPALTGKKPFASALARLYGKASVSGQKRIVQLMETDFYDMRCFADKFYDLCGQIEWKDLQQVDFAALIVDLMQWDWRDYDYPVRYRWLETVMR